MTITATLVPEGKRMEFLSTKLGSIVDSLRTENHIFNWMGKLSADYGGGYWDFYDLSNGGFYMAPHGDTPMTLHVEGSGFSGSVAPETAGVIATLFALNNLVWKDPSKEKFHDLYYKLYDYAIERPDAGLIAEAID